MMKFILAFVLGLSAISAFAADQAPVAQDPADEVDTGPLSDPANPIVELDNTIQIYIRADQMTKMQDVYLLFMLGLDLPEDFGMNLDALNDVLRDPAIFKKKLEVTIEGGARLRQIIGGKNFDGLMKILDDAEESNRDKDGIKNITNFYFQ
jgi:RNAse (barnase) inhibitor barstar